MYLDWILTIVAILIIVFLLYAIYLLVEPRRQSVSEAFQLVHTPAQEYSIPQLKGVTGRYVRIRPSLDPKADGYLTISQIQVFDINGRNVALKARVTSTSEGGSPIDKKYGVEVVVGNINKFQPGISDSPSCIVDGVTIPRNSLNNVFETGVQNFCGAGSVNCSTPVTTDSEYVEIDLSGNTIIKSIVYTGRGDPETRTIQSIDGDFDYLTQVDRIKGMRLEIYDTQRKMNFSAIFPTTDTVQTITIPNNLYGVNLGAGSGGSMLPLTTVSVPNLASFKDFVAPLQKYTVQPTRPQDANTSPLLLAYRPMISAIDRIYKDVDIDLSNNIFLPVLIDSPINFYYDLYKQSGCNPVCFQGSAGVSGCTVPTACVSVCNQVCTGTGASQSCTVPATCAPENKTNYCPPTYCVPPGSTLPAITETIPVNIFGTASATAIQEMNQSIEYCKTLYLGSPPGVENFIRLNFSYTDITQIKAYLRGSSVANPSTGSGAQLPRTPLTFCVPDIIQRFRNGRFITSFSARNNAWNAVNCATELTPTILGLIPFASRNFLVQWISNRTVRYKHFRNMLSTNISYALEDLNSARADLAAANQAINDAANPANFTPTEYGIIAGSSVLFLVPAVGQFLSGIFNPVTVLAGISATKAIMATAKRDKVQSAVNAAQETYNAVVAQGASVSGQQAIEETATPLQIPAYISMNSKSVIDSIAQQFYELMGGQFNMSYIYDILPLGSTMLDIRFDVYIHDSVSVVSPPINDLKAQYKRVKAATAVSKDILDQAAADYQTKLSALEEISIQSISNPFQGAVARLFYTTSGTAINITGIIFDERAVTSFIPELNGGIPVPLGPTPGNINYKPKVLFTKNQVEPLDCTNTDTLRRIFDDYIQLVSDKKNKYPLATAVPPLDVKKGILYVTSVLGVSQLSPTSCSLSWSETLYDPNTNLPISGSTQITRNATFAYKADSSSWYSSELTIDMKGITFLASSAGINPTQGSQFTFIKPLPARSNLDNLSNICPTTSCEDPDILYSIVDQYNSDPTLPGTILTVTHAFTPNPNQCDVKVSINYDSQIEGILGQDTRDPVTGVTTTTYKNIKKGTVTYSSVNNSLIEGSKPMPYSGVQKDITMAMYVAVDPATCGYTLADASGQNTGTSIQSNTPALFTPMIYSNEVIKRKGAELGSSVNTLQTNFTQAAGSTKGVLKSYRIKGYNALSGVYGAQGVAACSGKPCNDPTITQMMKNYYASTLQNNNGIQISTFINIAQINTNACEATFITNASSAPFAYKFTMNPTSCAIQTATPLLITGPTDDQILDITKEMNAAVTEAFTSARAVESEALGVRGFGMDALRNSDASIKDSQYQLPLKQRPPEKKTRPAPPSYKFLRFTPTATRGREAAAVNVGKFTFFYEGYPLFLKGSVTNPMGTWEGTMADVTGAGPKPGWSDAHKKSLVFAFRDAIAVDAYTFATALPEAGIEGDPISWKLEGSPNGTFWTTLDTQTNVAVPVRRFAELEKMYIA